MNEPPNSTEGNQLNVLSLAELYNSSFFHLLNSFLESAFGNSHYPCTTPPLFKIFMENFNKESVKIMTIICLITNSVFSVTKVPATHSLSLLPTHISGEKIEVQRGEVPGLLSDNTRAKSSLLPPNPLIISLFGICSLCDGVTRRRACCYYCDSRLHTPLGTVYFSKSLPFIHSFIQAVNPSLKIYLSIN